MVRRWASSQLTQRRSTVRLTGRGAEQVELVERYTKEQGSFIRSLPAPEFTKRLSLDMSTVVPSLGAKRPQDRVPMVQVKGVQGA